MDDLDGDVLLVVLVVGRVTPGLVHAPHAAAADLAQDPVGPDALRDPRRARAVAPSGGRRGDVAGRRLLEPLDHREHGKERADVGGEGGVLEGVRLDRRTLAAPRAVDVFLRQAIERAGGLERGRIVVPRLMHRPPGASIAAPASAFRSRSGQEANRPGTETRISVVSVPRGESGTITSDELPGARRPLPSCMIDRYSCAYLHPCSSIRATNDLRGCSASCPRIPVRQPAGRAPCFPVRLAGSSSSRTAPRGPSGASPGPSSPPRWARGSRRWSPRGW